MPQQFVIGAGDFEMWSQEFRVTTPLDEPVHATVGAYLDRQMHNIWQNYTMPGYGYTNVYGGNPGGYGYLPGTGPSGYPTNVSIPGFPNTIWLTDEQRVDRDRAVFGQATWDINSQWSVTGGARYYKYDNSLLGFYGFSSNTFYPNGMHMDLYISNLMNRLAELSRYTESNPSLDNQVYILPTQPRTFGLEFGQDF